MSESEAPQLSTTVKMIVWEPGVSKAKLLLIPEPLKEQLQKGKDNRLTHRFHQCSKSKIEDLNLDLKMCLHQILQIGLLPDKVMKFHWKIHIRGKSFAVKIGCGRTIWKSRRFQIRSREIYLLCQFPGTNIIWLVPLWPSESMTVNITDIVTRWVTKEEIPSELTFNENEESWDVYITKFRLDNLQNVKTWFKKIRA